MVEFVRGRSVPCPRCGYELHGLEQPKCPECGEPLVLKVGSPRSHFGWLILAMVPGCFSGVATVILFWPLYITITSNPQGKSGMPVSVRCAVVFGFLSAVSVVVMYRKRERILGWSSAMQCVFAACVWGTHLLAFAVLVFVLTYFKV